MVFERARQKPVVIGYQCGGHRIPKVAVDRLTLEGERPRLISINERTVGRIKTRIHDAVSDAEKSTRDEKHSLAS